MKHGPITLGFAAFSALTVLAACNVDSSRIDKDADTTYKKLNCKALNAFDINAVQENRSKKLKEFDKNEFRFITASKGKDPVAHRSDEMHVFPEKRLNCDELVAETLDNDGNVIETASIEEVNTHKLVLKKEDGTTITFETSGIDVFMPEIDSEDGFNILKKTTTKDDVIEDLVITQTVKHKSDELVATEDEVKFMLNEKFQNNSETAKDMFGKLSVSDDGNVSLNMDLLEKAAEENFKKNSEMKAVMEKEKDNKRSSGF